MSTVDIQEEVRYRVVSEQGLELLTPLFTKLGWPPLDPNYAKVIVAEAGLGKDAVILGFQVVQFVCHAEPMWVHHNCRGTGVAEELVKQTVHYIEDDCHITKYVCMAKSGSFAARLAEDYGMVPVPGQVFVKQVPTKES